MIWRRKKGWLDVWVSVEDGAGNTSIRKRCFFKADAEGVFKNAEPLSFRMRTDLEPRVFRVRGAYSAATPMVESKLAVGEDMRKTLESAASTTVPQTVDVWPGSIELRFHPDPADMP